MSATIRNCLNQPLTINLLEGRSVHLMAKGKGEIAEADMNATELKKHVAKGNIITIME